MNLIVLTYDEFWVSDLKVWFLNFENEYDKPIWIVVGFGDEWLMMKMKVLDDYLGWSDEYLVWGWWRWRLWGDKDEDECLKDEDL